MTSKVNCLNRRRKVRQALGGIGLLSFGTVVLAATPIDALLFYWLFLLMLLVLVLTLIRPRRAADFESEQEALLPTALPEWQQSPGVRQVLDVKIATMQRGIEIYQGRLLRAPGDAFTYLRRYFAPLHKLPQLEEVEGGRVQLVVLPEPEAVRTIRKPNLFLHWTLFLLTLGTMTFAGGLQAGFNIFNQPHRIAEALPYSVGLLLILAFHEFGHYFMARHYRMNVTPPYFIPVPFGGIGTFGAFIQLRSPSERRRTLFDVAVAGPLAGMLVAVPALYFGLTQSRMLPVPPENALMLGLGPLESPWLMDWLARLALGENYLPGGFLDLSLLARAGYLGLLLTMLNLLPIGQLDGGHIAHAMFGPKIARMLGVVTLLSMFAIGVLLPIPALVTWALIVFFIAGVRDVPPLDDISPINMPRRLVGLLAFAILLSIAIPSPQRIDAGRMSAQGEPERVTAPAPAAVPRVSPPAPGWRDPGMGVGVPLDDAAAAALGNAAARAAANDDDAAAAAADALDAATAALPPLQPLQPLLGGDPLPAAPASVTPAKGAPSADPAVPRIRIRIKPPAPDPVTPADLAGVGMNWT